MAIHDVDSLLLYVLHADTIDVIDGASLLVGSKFADAGRKNVGEGNLNQYGTFCVGNSPIALHLLLLATTDVIAEIGFAILVLHTNRNGGIARPFGKVALSIAPTVTASRTLLGFFDELLGGGIPAIYLCFIE